MDDSPRRREQRHDDDTSAGREVALEVGSLAGSRWDVRVLDATPSTNSVARDLALAGTGEGAVVTTLDQTAGRGRLTRQWVTPRGASLSTSALLVPPATVPPQRWPWLSLVTGLAVRDALADLGVAGALKWPNDVLVQDHKIAGILVERVEVAGGAAAVVGVGLNVAARGEDLPPTGTSLRLQGATTDAGEVLEALLEALGHRYDAWLAADGDPAAGDGRLLEDYRAACSTIGADVRVHLPRDAVLAGRCTDVDAEGHLVVEAGGRTHQLGVGDVVHVRAAGAAGRRPTD